MMTLPITLDAKALSALLFKSESSILRDVSRNPKALPPFSKPGKKPIWLSQVVVDWIAGKSNLPVVIKIEFQPPATGAATAPPRRSLAEDLMAGRGEK